MSLIVINEIHRNPQFTFIIQQNCCGYGGSVHYWNDFFLCVSCQNINHPINLNLNRTCLHIWIENARH
jgi:hypothetical protein